MPRFDDLADRCANLAADISLDRIDAERVGWLGTLIGQYEREHDWDADIDPSATMEMIREVTALHKAIEKIHDGQFPETQDADRTS